MSDTISSRVPLQHSHSFLGAGHERSERKTWAVIWLCGVVMIAELIGGMLFGSIALVADGMHMSTHVGDLILRCPMNCPEKCVNCRSNKLGSWVQIDTLVGNPFVGTG
jgi:hypothetical protein